MSRKFISIVVAASVAVAGMTATQAQADKRTRNLVLGATALAILGAAASQSKADTVTRQTHAQPRHGHKHGDWHWHGNVHHRHDGNNHGRIRDRVRDDSDANGRTRDRVRDRTRDRDRTRNPDRRPRTDVFPRPLPGRVLMSELPRRCLVTIKNRRGTHKIFEKRCLERNYRHADALPQMCKVKVRAGGRKVRGYYKHCLKQFNQQANRRNR